MTETTEYTPLTPEEEAQRAELNYRAAMADWQANEDERVAQLALLEPVVGAFTGKADVDTLLGTLEGNVEALPEEEKRSVQRIIQILNLDAKRLKKSYDALSTAQPQPEAPESVTP